MTFRGRTERAGAGRGVLLSSPYFSQHAHEPSSLRFVALFESASHGRASRDCWRPTRRPQSHRQSNTFQVPDNVLIWIPGAKFGSLAVGANRLTNTIMSPAKLKWWQWLLVGTGFCVVAILMGVLSDRGIFAGLIVAILAWIACIVCWVVGFIRFVKWVWSMRSSD